MATIDNLNFGVILDDKAFIDAINNDIGKAKELNGTLSKALTNKLPAGSTGLRNFNTHLSRSNNLMRTLGQLTGVAFSVVGIRRFLSTLIDVTGQFEVQKMALRNMLQDIDAADKIFQDLYNFSSESTYRFSELAKYAKQLAAFNIDKNNLLETTKMLGDVASGVGVSMDRLILAYGHVKSSGFLRGIQLRSFSQNGVPILEELSKMFTEIEGKAVSLGDVFDKMMKREIGFDMVEEAFRRMTSEGGKFYQMQEVLAKTLSGQINILKGKWENLMYAIGQSQEGVLKGVVSSLTNIVSNMENFGRVLKEAVAILGAYRVAMITSVAVTEGLASAINVSLVGRAFKNLWAVIAKNPYAMLAAGATLLIAEVIKANNALSDSEKITDAVTKSVSKYEAALASESAEMERLYTKLRLAKEGTEEYDKAKLAIENRFGSYLQQIRAENTQITNLADTYQLLADKIREAQKAKFLESASGEVQGAFESATSNIYESFKKTAEANKWSIGQQEDIWRYIITGQLSDQSNFDQLSRMGGGTIGIPGTIFYKDLGRSADSLRSSYLQAARAFDDGMTALEAAFSSHKNTIDGAEGSPEQQVIKISSVVEGIKNIDKELAKLRNKAKSSGGITEDEQKRIEALTEDREEQAKLYKSIMGKDYDKSIKSAQTEQNKAVKDRISSIKAEISILEKYRDAREKLEPFFGEQTDLQLSKLFGARDYSTLDTELQGLIASLRALGDEGAQAADQIEARLGMDALSLLLAKQRDLKKYDDNLKKYLGEDFSYSGSSLEYKTSRILAEYNTKVATATREYEELHKNLVALGQDTSELEAQFQAQLAQLAADRDNKIAELAKSIYGKQTGNLNLTEWAHKSGKEIKEIIAALRNIQVPKELADMLDEGALNALSDALKELASEDIEKALTKLDDNRLRNLQKAASVVSSIAGAVKEYAEASGNDNLAAMAEALAFIADTAGAVFDRLAQGDYAGAVLAVVGGIAKEIMAAATAAAQLNAALAEAVEKSRVLGMSKDLKAGVENLFGESGLRKIQNAAELAEKLRKTAYTGKGKFLSGRDAFFLPKWETMIGNLAAGVGGELYDDYGNLNADTLKLILGTYKKLDTESKQWIQHAIDDTEAYKDAMEQLDGVVKDVFGNIAGQAADKIVEQWKARGDAALDYADILDDVATRYAKMITESMLIDSVLTPEFKAQLQTLFKNGDTEGAMALILGGMQQMQAMAPEIAQALEPLRPYIQTDGSGTDPLKDGINKELVEGNSSLIASYMNAMRADLSVLRQLQTAGWADVRLVRETMPTLADHVARIEANTYDNAVAAQGILSKLSSIITPSTNGGSAVRTTK